jgi:hypothetical protein
MVIGVLFILQTFEIIGLISNNHNQMFKFPLIIFIFFQIVAFCYFVLVVVGP